MSPYIHLADWTLVNQPKYCHRLEGENPLPLQNSLSRPLSVYGLPSGGIDQQTWILDQGSGLTKFQASSDSATFCYLSGFSHNAR
jgi:hypothetical protein